MTRKRPSPLRVLWAASAVATAAVLGGVPAYAADGDSPTGTLTFQPASGLDSAPLTAVSTGVCSDPRGTNLQLRVSGSGFPPDTNVTPNLKASIYPVDPSTGGYDVPLQDTLQDFAAQQTPAAKLSGRYDFILVCKKPLGRGVYDTYVGSLVFNSPSHFHAVTPEVAVTPAVSSSQIPPTSSLATPTKVHATPAPTTHPVLPATPKKPPTTPTTTTLASVATVLRTPRPSAHTRPFASPKSGPTSTPASPDTGVPSADVLLGSSARATSAPATPVAALPATARPSSGVAARVVTLTSTALVVVVLLGLVLRRRVNRWRTP